MLEIGGYIEFETYRGSLFHEQAIGLNCGRSCLAYLIQVKNIKKILLPYFICDSVINLCRKYGVEVRFFHIGKDFYPVDLNVQEEEWVYIVDYYGLITSDYIKDLKDQYSRVIVDYAQAYFKKPVENVDSLYTCRKFFGVADGAFLYTDAEYKGEIPQDESYDRMHFLLGRFERSASEFYSEYVDNNHFFADEPIKKMSRLTENLLRGIDYENTCRRRTQNYDYLNKRLGQINELVTGPVEGAFAYPLKIQDGEKLRKHLIGKKIFVPLLWPNVLDNDDQFYEVELAKNTVPIPCDQRYGQEEMEYICQAIIDFLNN